MTFFIEQWKKERNKVVFSDSFFLPHVGNDYTGIDFLGLTKKDQVVGIKIVSSANEMNRFSKEPIAKLFSAIWYLPRSPIRGKVYYDIIPIFERKNIPNWMLEKLEDVKSISAGEFQELLEETKK